MRTLLIDATSLSPNPKGVGKYAWEVVDRLDQLLPQSWRIILIVFRKSKPSFNCSQRFSFVEIDQQSGLKLGLISVPALIRKTGADLLLRLCDDVGRNYMLPTMTVCHDINELIARAQGEKHSLVRHLINGVKEFFRVRALRASEMIVCNSEFTRQQSIVRYGINEEKVVIGYCGIADGLYHTNKDEGVQRIHATFGAENYILCFATGDPRENYAIIPDLIAATKRLGLSVCYVIAGVREGHEYARDFKNALIGQELIESADYILVPFIGNNERQILYDLYIAADYYLELSLHEGFGMQLAEAMASGTKCFAPDHSALTEVGGPYVQHIDPNNVNSIAHLIVASNREKFHESNQLAQIEYTKRFSWDVTASVIATNLIKLSEAKKKSG